MKKSQQSAGVVPPSHANRPYFESSTFPSPSRRGMPLPMLHDHWSPIRAGGVYRDVDSSTRALAEMAKKRQERVERKRAAGLLLSLVAFAFSLHHVTMHTGWNKRASSPKTTDYYTTTRDKVYDNHNNMINTHYGGPANSSSSLTKSAGGRVNANNLGAAGITEDERHVNINRNGADNPPLTEAGGPHPERSNVNPNYVDFIDPRHPLDVPFFFHIPRSGGQTIKEIVGTCLGLVQASEVGVRQGHDQDTTLQKVEIEGGHFVNVDTTTLEGLQRAATMGMAVFANMTDVVTSSYFLQAGELLFSPQHPGRAFTMMRNPIERAISMYHYKQAQGQLDASVTLEEYGEGNGIENNWMVRYLAGVMEGELQKSHLVQAMEVLKRKFLVGFLDDKEESIVRIMKYMGWEFNAQDETKGERQQDCVKNILKDGTNHGAVEYDIPKKGTRAYALLAWQTQFDMKLYDFAKLLFEKQTKQYGSKQRKKELKKRNKAAKESKHG